MPLQVLMLMNLAMNSHQIKSSDAPKNILDNDYEYIQTAHNSDNESQDDFIMINNPDFAGLQDPNYQLNLYDESDDELDDEDYGGMPTEEEIQNAIKLLGYDLSSFSDEDIENALRYFGFDLTSFDDDQDNENVDQLQITAIQDQTMEKIAAIEDQATQEVAQANNDSDVNAIEQDALKAIEQKIDQGNLAIALIAIEQKADQGTFAYEENSTKPQVDSGKKDKQSKKQNKKAEKQPDFTNPKSNFKNVRSVFTNKSISNSTPDLTNSKSGARKKSDTRKKAVSGFEKAKLDIQQFATKAEKAITDAAHKAFKK